MIDKMSIEDVKRCLPEIKIRCESGEIKTGHVYGRNLKFAKVSCDDWGCFGFDVAWETITRAINNDTPISL